ALGTGGRTGDDQIPHWTDRGDHRLLRFLAHRIPVVGSGAGRLPDPAAGGDRFGPGSAAEQGARPVVSHRPLPLTRHTGGRPSPQEADAHRQMEERRRRRWDSRTRAPPGRSWPAGSRARTALPSTGTRTAPMPRRSPAPTATGSRSGPAAPTVVTDTTVRPPMMRGRAADRGCGPRAWSG